MPLSPQDLPAGGQVKARSTNTLLLGDSQILPWRHSQIWEKALTQMTACDFEQEAAPAALYVESASHLKIFCSLVPSYIAKALMRIHHQITRLHHTEVIYLLDSCSASFPVFRGCKPL